jgi:hypothetical protein
MAAQRLLIERNEMVATRERLEALFDLVLDTVLKDGRVDAAEAADLNEILDGIECHVDQVRLWLAMQSGRLVYAPKLLKSVAPALPSPDAWPDDGAPYPVDPCDFFDGPAPMGDAA